jgi:DNA-directed RNA polymerase subunit RPC12/RpoP
MTTRTLSPFDYDDLRTCPYCGGTNLMSAASDRYLVLKQCDHFVAAFENGPWARGICPPVTCNGFLFDQWELEEAAAQIDDAVMKVKPGTRRHPRIAAIYCRHPETANTLRKTFRSVPVDSGACAECGNKTAVIGDHDEIVCALCGALSDLPKDLAEE